MPYHTMTILADGSERVHYNDPSYPVYASPGRLKNQPDMKVIHHWHEDLEFVHVLKGHMMYSVNGEHIRLEEGEAIYVSPRQVHRNYSEDKTDAFYHAVLLHPSIFRNSFGTVENEIIRLLQGEGRNYVKLSPEVPWQKIVIDEQEHIYRMITKKADHKMIGITGAAFNILYQLLLNLPEQPAAVHPDRRIPTLRNMVSFIQKHYPEKIKIEDICRAGGVGTSTCYELFKKGVGATPQNYLMLYRLEKAGELLRNPGLSITDIAYAAGFSGASYFAECFKKGFGISPSEFRTRVFTSDPITEADAVLGKI